MILSSKLHLLFQSEINHIWKFPAAGFIRNRRRVLDPENRAAPAAGEKTIRRFFFLLLFSLIFPLFPGSRPRLDSGKPAGLLHGTGAL